MIVRNEKGQVVQNDEIIRYVLERHNEVLVAVLAASDAGVSINILYKEWLQRRLQEAAEAIPTIDKQRGHSAEENTDAISSGDENPGPE